MSSKHTLNKHAEEKLCLEIHSDGSLLLRRNDVYVQRMRCVHSYMIGEFFVSDSEGADNETAMAFARQICSHDVPAHLYGDVIVEALNEKKSSLLRTLKENIVKDK